MLASHLVGAIWLVLVIAMPLLVVGWVVRFVLALRLRVIDRDAGRGLNHAAAQGPSLGGVAQWSTLAATTLVLIGLPVIGWSAGGDAAEGYTIRNVYLLGTMRLPVLAVQAVPAHITWVSTQGEAARSFESRQCLLYLGRADGTAVFFDVASEESLRFPTDEIIITLENTTGVPDGC